MKNLVLVVDDEKGIRDGLKLQLESNGFEVATARNGEEALKAYNDCRPDLILLDVMMPKMDGFTVCRTIRKADTVTPLVMLTCKDSEIDQVKAFEFGAVDFIRKSDLNSSVMTEAVFVSVLDRHIKRVAELAGDRSGAKVFAVGMAEVDTEALAIKAPGLRENLTATEADMLQILDRNRGKCTTYDEMVDRLRGDGYLMEAHALQVHMSRIKAKLGRSGDKIRNIRNRGYLLER